MYGVLSAVVPVTDAAEGSAAFAPLVTPPLLSSGPSRDMSWVEPDGGCLASFSIGAVAAERDFRSRSSIAARDSLSVSIFATAWQMDHTLNLLNAAAAAAQIGDCCSRAYPHAIKRGLRRRLQ